MIEHCESENSETSIDMEEYSIPAAAALLDVPQTQIYDWINSEAINSRISTYGLSAQRMTHVRVNLPEVFVRAVMDIRHIVDQKLRQPLNSPQDLQALTRDMIDARDALLQVKNRRNQDNLVC